VSSETLRKWHHRLFLFWMVPGNLISITLVLLSGQKIILVWNLVVSMYTVSMEHFLGMRQEEQNDD
jgi:hypothetical protein